MSKLYDNITKLCQERGISGYKLCRDLSIQPSILTDLKMGRKSGLSAANASKIADYFSVSVGFLLGTQEKEELDDFTYAMYRETRDLSEENRQTLLQMARFFRQQQEK